MQIEICINFKVRISEVFYVTRLIFSPNADADVTPAEV